jgi:hypothetical protein
MSSVVKKITEEFIRICEKISSFPTKRDYIRNGDAKSVIRELPPDYKFIDLIKELRENKFVVFSLEKETQTRYIFIFRHEETFNPYFFQCTVTHSNGYVVEILFELV